MMKRIVILFTSTITEITQIDTEFKSLSFPSPKLQRAWKAMTVKLLNGMRTFSVPCAVDTLFCLVILVKHDHPKEPWLLLSLQII